MNDLVHVNDDSFEAEVATGSVLVEFGAVWCGPCKRQLPILEQLKQEIPDLKIFLVDIEDAPAISTKLGIRSVPTLVLFKNGEKVKSQVGLMTLAGLKAFI